MSVRLDAWLVQNGMFGGRDTAKAHILAGEVQINGKTVKKPAATVLDGDTVLCSGSEKFVGRGGYKLEKALLQSGISLQGAVALDVGASTGGFTDCMLQNGIKKVYAVDVGHGQLHPSLLQNAAVVSLENTDIRDVAVAERIKEPPSFCSIDVSFISLKQVLPSAISLLGEDATLVCLIKPQFEVGKAFIGKNGVVKDKAAHVTLLRELCVFFGELECGLISLTHSPIRGGEGNIEYLATLRRGVSGSIPDIAAVVKDAFLQL